MSFASQAFASWDEQSPNIIRDINFYDPSPDANYIRNILFELQEELDSIYTSDSENDDTTAAGENDNTTTTDIIEKVKAGREALRDALMKYHEAKKDYDHVQKEYEQEVSNLKLVKQGMSSLTNNAEEWAALYIKTENEICEAAKGKLRECMIKMEEAKRIVNKLRDVFKILKTTDSTFACPICLRHQVECFLTPCGHTFCANCASKANLTCFICRQKFHIIGNLFFC